MKTFGLILVLLGALAGCAAGPYTVEPDVAEAILPAVDRFEAYVPLKADPADVSELLGQSAAFRALLTVETTEDALDAAGEPILKLHDKWVDEDLTLEPGDRLMFKRTTWLWRKLLREDQ